MEQEKTVRQALAKGNYFACTLIDYSIFIVHHTSVDSDCTIRVFCYSPSNSISRDNSI